MKPTLLDKLLFKTFSSRRRRELLSDSSVVRDKLGDLVQQLALSEMPDEARHRWYDLLDNLARTQQAMLQASSETDFALVDVLHKATAVVEAADKLQGFASELKLPWPPGGSQTDGTDESFVDGEMLWLASVELTRELLDSCFRLHQQMRRSAADMPPSMPSGMPEDDLLPIDDYLNG